MKNKTFIEKFKVFLGLDDLPAPKSKPKAKAKNQSSINLSYFKKANAEIKIIAPKKYSDALHIAQLLKNDTPMVLNFQYMDKMNIKRFMDFITGNLYSLNGNMCKLTDHLILISSEKTAIVEETPKNLSKPKNNANEEIVINLINNN